MAVVGDPLGRAGTSGCPGGASSTRRACDLMMMMMVVVLAMSERIPRLGQLKNNS